MVSGHEIETKSEATHQIVKLDLFRAPRGDLLRTQIGIVGDHLHVQQALAQFGDAAADIADPDDADGLALRLVADQRIAVDVGLAAQRAVGLEDALGQRQHHAERMFGDGIGVAAGLIDDEHARRRAGIDVNGIEARAVRRHDQEVRRPLQQIVIDMEMPGDLVARRADLIGMRRRQYRCRDRIRTIVLQPVEPHVGAAFQDIDIDLVGEIFDIEHALVVDGHVCWQLSVRKGVAADWLAG